MAVTNLPSNTANKLLQMCHKSFPELSFKLAGSFYWSPKTRTVFYDQNQLASAPGQWALLHEVAHGQLDHQQYHNDFELLMFELAAWEAAKEAGVRLGLKIDQDHIEDCLDSYRDWLYARSTCPACRLNSLQISPQEYRCLNCNNSWKVSASRFCRPYRMHKKASPSSKT